MYKVSQCQRSICRLHTTFLGHYEEQLGHAIREQSCKVSWLHRSRDLECPCQQWESESERKRHVKRLWHTVYVTVLLLFEISIFTEHLLPSHKRVYLGLFLFALSIFSLRPWYIFHEDASKSNYLQPHMNTHIYLFLFSGRHSALEVFILLIKSVKK